MDSQEWIQEVIELTVNLRNSNGNCSNFINQYNTLANLYEDVRATTFNDDALKEQVDMTFAMLHDTYKQLCTVGGSRKLRRSKSINKRRNKRRFTHRRR
jgi:hypothetical protein